LCAILQSTLVSNVAIFGVKPDLLLLVLFNMSVRHGIMPGIYAGFFLGLSQDLFSPGLLGQNALAMSFAGCFSGLFNERVMRLDPVLRASLLVAAFIVNDTAAMLVHIMKTGGDTGTLFFELLVATLPRSLYTALVAAIPFVWVNIVKPRRLVD
jgi:rod shape-determining protein MreD